MCPGHVLPRGRWGKGRPPPLPRGLFLGLLYRFHQTWNFSVKGLRSRAAVGGDGRPRTQTSTGPTSGERADPPPGDDLTYTVALRTDLRTCRVLWGLRICLAIQGTQVQHLVRELRRHLPCGTARTTTTTRLMVSEDRFKARSSTVDSNFIYPCCQLSPKLLFWFW